jgi:predicted permease
MRLIDVLKLRLQSLTGRTSLENSLDEEMRFHLDHLIEEKIASGMSPRDARSEALRDFGNAALLQEECRDERRVAWIENLIRDTRYGWRTFLKNPSFTLTAVLSLALGIGGAMAVFTIIESVMLKSLPVRDPHELVTIEPKVRTSDRRIRILDLERILEAAPIFQSTYSSMIRNYVRIAIGDRQVDQVASTQVTHRFFDVLGVRPAAGRFFAADDEAVPESAKTAGSVVVISYDLWDREFGRDPSAIGKTLTYNQANCKIIGVAPAGFFGDAVGEKIDLWAPMIPFVEKERLQSLERSVFGIQNMGRLKPDVTRAQATAQLTAAYQQIQSTRQMGIIFTRDEKGAWTRFEPKPTDFRIELADGNLGFDLIRTRYRQPLLLMLGATLLVFLTGCANVANLLLTRGVMRRHELGIRQSLGAGRGRIVTQLLTECLLLAAMASIAGLALGRWGSAVLVNLVEVGRPNTPVSLDPGWRLGLLLCGLTVAAIVIFGLGPAWRQSKVAAGARVGLGRNREWPHRALIVAQVAMSIVLLCGAALLGQTIRNLRSQDFGFRPDQLISMTYRLDVKEASNERMTAVAKRLAQRVETIPGVASAAASASGLFGDSHWYQTFPLPGSAGEGPLVRADSVSPRYFETVGIPLVAGRAFSEIEDVPVAIVNETFSKKLLGGKDPVGLRLEGKSPRRIVGVVRDARYTNARTEFEPALFLPMTGEEGPVRRLEVRTAADPQAVIGMIREAVRETDRDIVIERVSTMTADIDRSFQRELLLAKLVSAFSLLALTLSCIGLYGMMSYSVSRRVNEFGVRMALGARPGQLLGMVLRDSGLLLGAGVLVGVPCAWAASGLLQGFLFGVKAQDPWTAVVVAGVLVLAGLGAALLPARRAALVDPSTALRAEVFG